MLLGTWIQVLPPILQTRHVYFMIHLLFLIHRIYLLEMVIVFHLLDVAISPFLTHLLPFNSIILFMLLTSSQILSLRRLTTDNNVFVEYDPSNFFVKDLNSGKTIRRCPNSGPLYPLTHVLPSSSNISLAALSSSIWHNRLSHPSQDVFLIQILVVLFHVIRSIPLDFIILVS